MSESTKSPTGAVRSSDADHLSFTSLPLLGLLGVARTAGEGKYKYGYLNYARGFPVHDILEHVFRHYVLFLLGDRSEPHLEHAAWGALAAVQSFTLDPDLSKPHLLGPGATLTPEILERLAAEEPELAAKRKSGAFDGIGGWCLRDLAEVSRLLGQREAVRKTAEHIAKSATVGIAVVPAEPCDHATEFGFSDVPGRESLRDDMSTWPVIGTGRRVEISSSVRAYVSGRCRITSTGDFASYVTEGGMIEHPTPFPKGKTFLVRTSETCLLNGPLTIFTFDEPIRFHIDKPSR